MPSGTNEETNEETEPSAIDSRTGSGAACGSHAEPSDCSDGPSALRNEPGWPWPGPSEPQKA